MFAASGSPTWAAAFEYKGWEGFEIAEREVCRMVKLIDNDVYFVAESNGYGSFLLGVYRKSWSFETDTKINGAITFDDKPPIPLNGIVVNTDIILLDSEQSGFLSGEFTQSKFLKMSFGTGWVQLDLTGSSRAAELLHECAKEVGPGAGDEEEALRAAAPGQSNIPEPELGGLRQDMLYRDARRYLLEAGWQALYVLSDANDSPSDQKMRSEFGFPELASCSGTGMGFCAFGYKDAYSRELRLTTRGGDDFVVHAWEVLP